LRISRFLLIKLQRAEKLTNLNSSQITNIEKSSGLQVSHNLELKTASEAREKLSNFNPEPKQKLSFGSQRNVKSVMDA